MSYYSKLTTTPSRVLVIYLWYSINYQEYGAIHQHLQNKSSEQASAFKFEMDIYFELIVCRTREQPKFSPLSVQLQIHTHISNTHTHIKYTHTSNTTQCLLSSQYSRVFVHVGV